jgi:hypothetical protein
LDGAIRHKICDVSDHAGKPSPVPGVVGHRQVTGAYLAQLARSRSGQLATLDSGLAHLHSDVALLIPTTRQG